MGSPSTPKPPPQPPPPPTPIDEGVRIRRMQARQRMRSGRMDTILTSPMGLVSRGGTIASPTLLGGGMGGG